MLTLALVPSLGGIYLTTSLLGGHETELAAERAQQTSETAADLRAREAAIEARLLVAATDPGLARLADGIDGQAERESAERIVRTVSAGDPAAVTGVCLVRSSDGKRVPLTEGRRGLDACANVILRKRAADAGIDSVTRLTPATQDASRLLLATPTRSVTGRNRGVLAAGVDVTALFDRIRTDGGSASTSMLVDMGSSEVVATAASAAGPADGSLADDPAALRSLAAGVLGETEGARERLAASGLAGTVVPLWGNGDGTRMGLVQLWPNDEAGWPLEVRLLFLAMLASSILAVIVLVRYFLGPVADVGHTKEELQALYQEARRDALVDGLTGLGNHRAFEEELRRRIKAFEDHGLTFSLALLDLDHLKTTNDREGHAAGDEMLVSMARTMREFARADDRIFRTGGDEFAMILPGATVGDAIGVVERVLYFCKSPDRGVRPSPFSAGISGVPYFARERDVVYRQADAALYWAKRHGRGSVEVFEAERDQLPEGVDEATSNAVAEIITADLLRPVYQPIVDLRTGRVLGFEGLIRPDPDGPLTSTEQLFAAAALTGRTVELDLACLDTLVDSAKAIGPDRLLTLNLSPRTLEVKDFDPAWLLSGLVRNGISPSRVIIELTEREEVDDLGRLQQIFHLLQQYGLRLAADDVGAGNSGLRLLSQVNFDIVKVDLALVQSGARRVGARAVLESLRDLAASQNARIIAEGVETSRQLQVLREMDIGAAQGFLLGRPDASMERTFVDVERLESGVYAARGTHPVALPAPAATDTDEHRATVPPPARTVLETEPGTA
jgi:diguanylate cyclase (GGDEF)-like protein